jgi:hypothetical protein
MPTTQFETLLTKLLDDGVRSSPPMPPPVWYIATEQFGPQRGQAWHDYVAWSQLPQLTELVTLDHVLCPPIIDPPAPEDWAHNVNADFLIAFFVSLDHVLRRVGGRSNMNVLAVMREPSAADCAGFQVPGFTMTGFDLVEKPGLGISALTNCGGFPLAFANSALTNNGLLPTLALARAAQKKLREHYPAEPHADCHVWAIWRLATGH